MSDVDWLERAESSDEPDVAVGRVRLPELSRFFDGHFPSGGVFPAVAQFGLVCDLAGGVFGSSYGVPVEIRQARFRGSATPGDELSIRVARAGAQLRFRIDGSAGIVSQGVIETRVEAPT